MRGVIAGGGTGGHLFPGMAIAEAFVEREKGNEVLFIGTERGIESRVLAGGRFPLKTIRVSPLTGRALRAKTSALGTIPGAIGGALSILKEFRPQVVLGVGGYASGPTLLAALLLAEPFDLRVHGIVGPQDDCHDRAPCQVGGGAGLRAL